jgi:hypothetical protein
VRTLLFFSDFQSRKDAPGDKNRMAKDFASLYPYALDIVEHSMDHMDRYWDAAAGLLAMKSYERLSELPVVHHIRETSWYALGLLQRGSIADRERACEALQALLTYQFDEPGKPYDGTWYRFPEEPHPGTKGIWRGYDPNWREFIGTTLAIILLDYEHKLPRMLVQDIDEALRKAIRGMLARDLSASYSNIALMHAFLLFFAGERFGETSWLSIGEEFAREVYRLFALNNAFSEFNSPTYYGVDLYALGLWRTYSSSPLLQQLGAKMEAGLWQDIALMYHAGIKNMAGPYDRSYGMDMQQYATTIGMWIWMAIGRDAAPFPDITRPFEHSHDFCFAPCYVAVDVSVPEEVQPHLQAFQGERQVERVIANEPRRVATAWVGERLLLGAEYTSLSEPASNQIHPATIHWSSADNRIGWVRLVYIIPVNARAEKDALSISCISRGAETPDFVFQIYTPNKSAATFQPDLWQLAGLTIQIETNTEYVETRENGDYYKVSYTASKLAPGATVLFTLTTSEE